MKLYDCYKILSIEEDCSDLEVRTAYRRMAKLIHPDKKILLQDATSKFSELNEAYRNIINHRKRLNKIKFKIIHEYQKQQKNSINDVMPIYEQMQKTFQDHMKTLQTIQGKLNKMKQPQYSSFDSSPPLFTHF